MRHPQRKAIFRQPRRFFRGLSWRCQHKVHRNILKARGFCHCHRHFALRCGMAAAQQPQHLIFAVLQSKGNPVKARAPQRFQQGSRHRSGVRLCCYFGIISHRPPAAYRLQHRFQSGAQQRWGSAAKVDGLDLMPRQRCGSHRSHQRCGVRLPQGQVTPAVKAAISAPAPAKRHVEIQTHRLHDFPPSLFFHSTTLPPKRPLPPFLFFPFCHAIINC